MSDNVRFARLISKTARALAASLCAELPDGWTVTFRAPKRSDIQSAKMHAMARDLELQVPWCGQRLSVEQWKRFATAKLKKDRIVFDCNDKGEPDPNAGLIVLGASTRDMGTADVSAIIEWFYWMGAQHNVIWSDEEKKVAVLEGMKR